MTPKFLTFIVVVALFACSCSTGTHTPYNLKGSVSAIRLYLDSFEGLSMEIARARLAGAQFREEAWKEGGFGGKQLVATFPEYEILVLFSGGKVVTTSFQILSE